MPRRVDLNRIQKTYPYIRRKPIYRFVGETEDSAKGGTGGVGGDTNIYSIHEIDSGDPSYIQQEELSIFDFGDGKTGLFGFVFNQDSATGLHEVAITLTGISDATDTDEVTAESDAKDLYFEFDPSRPDSDYIMPKE